MSRTMLSDLPQAICTEVSAVLPKLRECRPHAGKFDVTELKRRGLPSSAVLISTLSAKQDATFAGHATSFMLQMAAYVVTKDSLGEQRDIKAANICQFLLSLIPEKDWGFSGVGPARDVKLHTLVSSKVKDQAVALWAVTWDQPITFFEPYDNPLNVELYAAQLSEGETASIDDFTQIGEAS